MTEMPRVARTGTAANTSAWSLLREMNEALAPREIVAQELPTGFNPLDAVLDGGLNAGDLCVIGGAPGVGKTILGLQMARNMAAAGHRVLYCCYEHDVPTLLGRLVSLEIGDLGSTETRKDGAVIRSSVRALMGNRWSATHPGANHPTIQAAMARVADYGDRLVLAQLSTAQPGLEAIQQLMADGDPFRAVFVDYLQKIGVTGTTPGIERWTVAVEELKDIALTRQCLVVAISALERDALKTKRVTLDGFRGADVIAHEADVAIALNSKLNIVSRSHLAYDARLHAKFAQATVFTIEKNRRGPSPVDMEFDKDFAWFRFDPYGRYVAERLIDHILVDD